MKLSERWLREWIDIDIDTATLVEQLTMAGLEVEAITPVGIPFQGVVIAKVIACKPHPNADRLQICEVDGGGEKLQIVCGASNVSVGMKVPLACVGAVLGVDKNVLKIKRSKLRGVVSEGMLCGASELGFEDDVDGLWELNKDAPIGMNLEDYLQLPDNTIELSITPNRSDCFSILGIVRELATINDVDYHQPFELTVETNIVDAYPSIDIVASHACHRYVGCFIRGIDNNVQTPQWMKDKLNRCAIRCHHPVVDITNYVMLELGQPLHAFDADLICGVVQVRMAKMGESLILLDGRKVILDDQTLVIADDTGAIAMAGIMGGQSTAVSEHSQNILLESAYFNPLAVAGKARHYGLHTDASHRFERGVDPQISGLAMARASQLLLSNVGGQIEPVIDLTTRQYPHCWQCTPIALNLDDVQQYLGCSLCSETIQKWFKSLGMQVQTDKRQWLVTPPSWRTDIVIAEDLIEEIARLHGYDNLPMEPLPIVPKKNKLPSECHLHSSLLRQNLVQRGFREIISYSFIDMDLAKIFTSAEQLICLKNPLTKDMNTMRPSLLPGLISTVSDNLKRQQSRLCLFEIGQCFKRTQDGRYSSENRIATVIYGHRHESFWDGESANFDFYDIKGHLQVLLNGYAYKLGSAHQFFVHPGQAATIIMGEQAVGVIATLHPKILNQWEINQPLFFFEFTLDANIQRTLPTFTSVSDFPEVRRDLAFIIDKSIATGEILDEIRQMQINFLQDIHLFDVYCGENIDMDKKSIAIRLIFNSITKTLHDKEVSDSMAFIVSKLQENYQITLR